MWFNFRKILYLLIQSFWTIYCRTLYGVLNNFGLFTFLTLLLFLVDSCAWRIVRLPLEPFYLIRPFFISTLVVSFVGYIFVPLIHTLKLHMIIKKGGPDRHIHKKGIPAMGGLYFIPVGIIVAEVLVGFSSAAVSGASVVTSAFASIGLLDDLLCFRNYKGLSSRLRFLFEVNFLVESLHLGFPPCVYFFIKPIIWKSE